MFMKNKSCSMETNGTTRNLDALGKHWRIYPEYNTSSSFRLSVQRNPIQRNKERTLLRIHGLVNSNATRYVLYLHDDDSEHDSRNLLDIQCPNPVSLVGSGNRSDL